MATLCHYRVGNGARPDDLFQKRLGLICYQHKGSMVDDALRGFDQRPRRQITADKYA